MKKFLTSNITSFAINLFFFIFLLIGIQNSNEKEKIYFLSYESAKIPTSFIVGTSFIAGSIISNFIFSVYKLNNKNNKNTKNQL